MQMGKTLVRVPTDTEQLLSKLFCKAFPEIRYPCSSAKKAGKKLEGSG